MLANGGFELENVALFNRLPGDLSLSVTHTHTHTLSLSLSLTHTHTHTRARAHALTTYKVVSHFNFVVAVVSNKKGCLCRWVFCTSYLPTCQVKATVGDSTHVMSFQCQLIPDLEHARARARAHTHIHIHNLRFVMKPVNIRYSGSRTELSDAQQYHVLLFLSF